MCFQFFRIFKSETLTHSGLVGAGWRRMAELPVAVSRLSAAAGAEAGTLGLAGILDWAGLVSGAGTAAGAGIVVVEAGRIVVVVVVVVV